MKKMLLILAVLIVLVVIIPGGLLLLAESHPFRPGDLLFPLQKTAENFQLAVTFDPIKKADLAIDLAERRLTELRQSIDSAQTLEAAGNFDNSISVAELQITVAPLSDRVRLMERMDDLMIMANELLITLVVTFPELSVLSNRIADLSEVINPKELDEISPTDGNSLANIVSETVPFVGDDFDHSFFSLTGSHEFLACVDCHQDGIYAGTEKECLACHLPPLDHFNGICSSCHVATNWSDVNFDHVGISDCQACHIQESPANHYDGQCSICHNTNTWQEATFDHNGYSDCLDCHITDLPANHFTGQCSSCHVTEDWFLVSFNHSGFTDCVGCHSSQVPLNHFSGQCSICHSIDAWKPALFTQHIFPLDHGGEGNISCDTCHTVNYVEYTCYNCHAHDPVDIRDEHVDEGIFNFTNCVDCHPTGLEDESDAIQGRGEDDD